MADTTEYHGDIFERLLEFYTPEDAERWMAAPHPQLEGRTADSLISEGVDGYKQVSQVLVRLETDAYI